MHRQPRTEVREVRRWQCHDIDYSPGAASVPAMLNPARSAVMRLVVITLYALAMATVGLVRHDAAADSPVIATGYALPGGESILLCQHANDGQSSPADGQPHHTCCDACVSTLAPGLAGAVGVEITPPQSDPIDPARLAGPRLIAVWRAEPTSRGPPRA